VSSGGIIHLRKETLGRLEPDSHCHAEDQLWVSSMSGIWVGDSNRHVSAIYFTSDQFKT